jgi:hypothetical protein
MRLRVADPTSTFDSVIDVPPGTTVGAVKQYVNSHLHYDTSNCLVFSAGHSPWDDSQALMLPDDTLLVFFNQEQFREKSYPSVDGSFAFPLSRFGKPQNRLADELDLSFDPDDSDSETSGDEMRIRCRPHIIREFVGDDGAEVRFDDLGDEMVIIEADDPLMPTTLRELWRLIGLADDEELEIHTIQRRMLDGEGFMRLDSDSDSEEEADERGMVALDGVPIDITAEQDAAVRRIQALVPGFDFNAVVQVYFACDGDEAATHECLLSMA